MPVIFPEKWVFKLKLTNNSHIVAEFGRRESNSLDTIMIVARLHTIRDGTAVVVCGGRDFRGRHFEGTQPVFSL